MIEYSIRTMHDKYLAWIVGNKPLVLHVKQPGWWMYRGIDHSTGRDAGDVIFTRGEIHTYMFGHALDINFTQSDMSPTTVLIVDGVPTVSGISIADQIVLEKMFDRFEKIWFSTKLTMRRPRL